MKGLTFFITIDIFKVLANVVSINIKSPYIVY